MECYVLYIFIVYSIISAYSLICIIIHINNLKPDDKNSNLEKAVLSGDSFMKMESSFIK